MDFEEEDEEEVSLTPPSAGNYADSPSAAIARLKMIVPATDHPVALTMRRPKYKECLKNHAIGIGGHAVDGCGEFMAAGEEGTLDALKCAACSCHRNFHRREAVDSDGYSTAISPAFYRSAPPAYLHVSSARAYHQHHHSLNHHHDNNNNNNNNHHHHPLLSQQTLALPSGDQDGEDDEDIMHHHHHYHHHGGGDGLAARKRFRTKFSQDQKEKMLDFAEKLGWRIQKHDDAAVEQFCMDTCISRHVLKVWMHNNKNTLGKKQLQQTSS